MKTALCTFFFFWLWIIWVISREDPKSTCIWSANSMHFIFTPSLYTEQMQDSLAAWKTFKDNQEPQN